MPPHDNSQNRPHEEGAGAVIGAIIVVILLIFGAFYFWGQKLNHQSTSTEPLVRTQLTTD